MKRLLIVAVALLGSACAAERSLEPNQEDEAEIAEALQGYEQAGPPVSCVSLRDLASNRSAGETAIIFEGHGGRLWVNRPSAGCPDLGFSRALQTKTTGTRLCRGDIATVFDRTTGATYGGCGLGEFTPYRRRAG